MREEAVPLTTLAAPAPLSKIGVIGDIHAQGWQLRLALEFLAGLGLQAILCSGDIVDGYGSVDECCALLAQYGVFTVRGNHDKWFLNRQMRDLPGATRPADLGPAALRYLAGLPVIREFETAQGRLLLCHGIGKDDMGCLTPDDEGDALEQNFELQDLILSRRYRFMVSGHTHRRMARTLSGLTVLNAGALTLDNEPGFLTVDFSAGVVQFYQIDPAQAVQEVQG